VHRGVERDQDDSRGADVQAVDEMELSTRQQSALLLRERLDQAADGLAGGGAGSRET